MQPNGKVFKKVKHFGAFYFFFKGFILFILLGGLREREREKNLSKMVRAQEMGENNILGVSGREDREVSWK